MFKKILCPVDFEQNSAVALRCARDLAKANNGKLYLLHVAAVASQGMTFPLEPYFPPSAEKLYKDEIEKFASDILDGTVPYEVIVHRGDPAEVITQTANEVAADLIVMATHGRKGINRLVLGSVAEQVVRESKQPVLTIRPDDTHSGYYEETQTS